MKVYTVFYVSDKGILEPIFSSGHKETTKLGIHDINESGEAFYDEMVVKDSDNKLVAALAFINNLSYYEGVALSSRQEGSLN